MRSKTFDASNIKELLARQKIATMPELQTTLGTHVNMTVIRKLQELSYHSSYSHKGKYYTLDEIGKKISDKQMESLKINRHEIFPKWNYTLMA
jgi:arginine repressor